MTQVVDIVAGGGPQAGWGGGWHGPWWILAALIWIGIVASVVWLLARRGGGTPPSSGAGAEGILAARYARGEIDTDEYRRRRDELQGLQ